MNYMSVPGISKQFRKGNSPQFIADVIIDTICKYFEITFDQLIAIDRTRKRTYMRQLAMYFLEKYTDMTLKAIGKKLNRDHTTVVHSKDLISGLIDVDDNIRTEVTIIKDRIAEAH
jgi:chromosomal replication initiator protein